MNKTIVNKSNIEMLYFPQAFQQKSKQVVSQLKIEMNFSLIKLGINFWTHWRCINTH